MGKSVSRCDVRWDYRGKGPLAMESKTYVGNTCIRKGMAWGFKQRQGSHQSPNQKIFSERLEDEREQAITWSTSEMNSMQL